MTDLSHYDPSNPVRTMTLEVVDAFGVPLYKFEVSTSGTESIGWDVGTWSRDFPIHPNHALPCQVRMRIE